MKEEILNILKTIGEYTSKGSGWIIKKISELGLEIKPTQIKILTLLINLILIYIFIKIIHIPKKMIKFAIILLLIVLAISIIASMLKT